MLGAPNGIRACRQGWTWTESAKNLKFGGAGVKKKKLVRVRHFHWVKKGTSVENPPKWRKEGKVSQKAKLGVLTRSQSEGVQEDQEDA